VNSFRQDYPQLGEPLDVVHHTEFLDELMRSGRLKLAKPDHDAAGAPAGRITYHDPCYLARVQNVTAAPRALLAQAAGDGGVVEMPRHGRETACCGAGGGRMWFEDKAVQRVGRGRIEEALATGAPILAVSCPFCQIMAADGLAARDGRMAVRDLVEILADQLPAEPAPAVTPTHTQP
jgi:Fe-S oxidoreductase